MQRYNKTFSEQRKIDMETFGVASYNRARAQMNRGRRGGYVSRGGRPASPGQEGAARDASDAPRSVSVRALHDHAAWLHGVLRARRESPALFRRP